MSKPRLNLYIAQRDLRLTDNPALFYAAQSARADEYSFASVYFSDTSFYHGNIGTHSYATDYIISKAVPEFASGFESFQFLYGDLSKLLRVLGAQHELHVYLNEIIEPKWKEFYTSEHEGCTLHLYPDHLSTDRNTVTGTGNLYSVFTPYKKKIWNEFVSLKPLPKPNLSGLEYVTLDYDSIELDQSKIYEHLSSRSEWHVDVSGNIISLDELIPKPNLDKQCYYSEEEALKVAKEFIKNNWNRYEEKRNNLDEDGTSKLSIGLTWGFISVRQVVEMVNNSGMVYEYDTFISELVWREWYKYLLHHRPTLLDQEFQSKFHNNALGWEYGENELELFKKWIKGETGYKAVDAAMNQLAQTGWMHNRARMIVGSILTKNLGVDWRWGQEYFRAVLSDLDEASNNGGWQWSASVGADPKPIRIFNPHLQDERFDTSGEYKAKWLSEGYDLEPVIEHKVARQIALERYGLKR